MVNPLAIEAMHESGLDISGHRSKHLSEFLSTPFDDVITVCDAAAETCPVFPGPARRTHWSFPDPAAVEGTREEKLSAFRAVRDDLERTLRGWLTAEGVALA
jgi:arsenate reductase